jgi:hypothetical protein
MSAWHQDRLPRLTVGRKLTSTSYYTPFIPKPIILKTVVTRACCDIRRLAVTLMEIPCTFCVYETHSRCALYTCAVRYTQLSRRMRIFMLATSRESASSVFLMPNHNFTLKMFALQTKFSLALIMYRIVNTFEEAELYLNLGCRWRWVATCTLRRLYLEEGVWVGPGFEPCLITVVNTKFTVRAWNIPLILQSCGR